MKYIILILLAILFLSCIAPLFQWFVLKANAETVTEYCFPQELLDTDLSNMKYEEEVDMADRISLQSRGSVRLAQGSNVIIEKKFKEIKAEIYSVELP